MLNKPAKYLEMIIDKNPQTFERHLVMALIHSHPFYLSVSDKLCPWDPGRAIRRSDFSVSHYNVLFEAIAFYWGMFGKAICKVPIAKQHLRNIIIDWNNSGRINTTVATQLVEEIDEDLFDGTMTKEFIADSVAGPAFSYWLETRLSKKSVDEIVNRSKSSVMTMDQVTEIIEKYKALRLATGNETIRGGDALSSKIRVRPKLMCSIPKLNQVLGGGFGLGEGTMIAGISGSGKTVLANQLALDFALAQRRVLYVTTEQPPDELIPRVVSNHLNLKYDLLTNRSEVQCALKAGEVADFDKVVAAIPDSVWQDPNQMSKLMKLEDTLNSYLLYLDWAGGKGRTIETDLDKAIEDIVTKGFDPEIIIFDWIGGGINTKGREEEKRHIYQSAADHLVEHGKRTRRAIIAFAQLDQNKATGCAMPVAAMLSECKTMINNYYNFIGISDIHDKGAGVRALRQNLNVSKCRNGTGGPVEVERQFGNQRYRGYKTIGSSVK